MRDILGSTWKRKGNNWKLLKEDNYCEIKPIRRDGKREKKRGKVEGNSQQTSKGWMKNTWTQKG